MKKLFIGVFVLTIFAACSDGQKIGYVENFKLYNEFQLTQELESELTSFQNSEKSHLDSLGIIFQQQTNYLQGLEEISNEQYQAYNDLRNALAFREKNFEEKIIEKSQEYDQLIWERLNTYVTEYAKENEFDLILGASGNGSLMYAKEDLDLTTQIIEFANSKYQGE